MASTMPVQLATSTSLSTVARVGLMGAPVRWPVRLLCSIFLKAWCSTNNTRAS